MDDIKTIAELAPIIHKLPVWVVAGGSIGFVVVTFLKAVLHFIKAHFDRSVQVTDERYQFLQQKIEPKLDKILEATSCIKDIKDDVEKISDKVLAVKCLRK